MEFNITQISWIKFSVSLLCQRDRSRGCSHSKSTKEEVLCFEHKEDSKFKFYVWEYSRLALTYL